MHPMLNVAIQAIRKAGNFIIKQYEFANRHNFSLSSDNIKLFISKIEIESTQIIIMIIKKFYPSHIINNNEKNILYTKDSHNVYWIINTIDNDDNFIKQFPFFALSIAVQYKAHIEIGVIYDPIHNELFSACRGQGAQYNGYRIRLNNQHHNISKNLKKAIFSISSLHFKHNIIIIDILCKLNQQYITVDFRRTGSLILDLAYVAVGRVDGCLIVSLKKINKLASAILIIKESGGFITDLHGNEIYHTKCTGNIIAGNIKIVKIIYSIIKNRINNTN